MSQSDASHGDMRQRVIVAGSTGDLGLKLVRSLAARKVEVVALVRARAGGGTLASLRELGVEPTVVDMTDGHALTTVMAGASCVISTLNGLAPVVLEAQGRLLDAAIAAGVPRFVPSDFSLDFTQTTPGGNRNLDLRRRFMERIDRAPIRATSVLNGGFIDLLGGQAPIVIPAIRRTVHFGDADQKLDFTAKDDVATFTAQVALDDAAPRILRIAGDSVSAADLATTMSDLTGRRYHTLRAGSIATLSGIISVARLLTPATGAPFPAWQGMQYLRDMMSGRGKLVQLDNDRYGARRWTSARETLASAFVR